MTMLEEAVELFEKLSPEGKRAELSRLSRVSEMYARLTPENRRIVNAKIDELLEAQNEDHD